MRNKPKQKTNGYKIAFWSVIFVVILFIFWIGFNSVVNNIYNAGYTKATIDEANYTSQTGVIYYLMNTSNYTSRNSTTISQLQYEAIASCVKSKVCTWNQTKYEELNRE